MILTDREIKIAIERRLISVDPPPNESVAFSSTALDLTLDSSILIFKDKPAGMNSEIDPSLPGFDANEKLRALTVSRKIAAAGYALMPNVLLLAWTRENVTLSIETRLAARVEGKSALARLGLGVHVTAPTIHSGFSGQIQLEMVNHGMAPIRLRAGMRICQLIFETTLGTPEKGYQGQFAGQIAANRRPKAA